MRHLELVLGRDRENWRESIRIGEELGSIFCNGPPEIALLHCVSGGEQILPFTIISYSPTHFES